MQTLRFGMPNGNIWIVHDDYFFTGSKDLNTAKQNFRSKTNMHSLGLYGDYSPRLGEYLLSIKTKAPMLIVGTNNYVRENVPFFILQKFDVHLFFMPNSDQVWRVGAILISRLEKTKPVILHSEDRCITEALGKLFIGITIEGNWHKETPMQEKMLVWYTNWVYRCPKIALKDIIHLETYKKEIA